MFVFCIDKHSFGCYNGITKRSVLTDMIAVIGVCFYNRQKGCRGAPLLFFSRDGETPDAPRPKGTGRKGLRRLSAEGTQQIFE